MKRKLCMLLALALMMICCAPLTALAASLPPDTAPAASSTPDAAATPSADPSQAPDTPVPIADQLHIDSTHIYDGMNMTYADGYVPTVEDGKVSIILPLVGQTHDGKVTITADLGATTDTPFVFGNYSQLAAGGSPYVFSLLIPLASGRINGAYPVILNADYLDDTGARVTQSFTVYVTITDGKKPVDPNAVTAPTKETVDKPELFISTCAIKPSSVGANEEFSVEVTVENIGSLRAKTVRLTYAGAAGGGEDSAAAAAGILPVETNNAIHLGSIAAGKTDSASFKLKTTADVLAGSQPFNITLDYSDAYGNVYTSTRQFLVAVTQPSEVGYDDIAASVPKSITAGESFTLPANVYNTGRSTVKNVMVTVTGAGLFPSAAVYLGDLAPGATGNGELSVFAGQLSMTEGYTEDYGKTDGRYIITYTDSAGAEQKTEIEFATEITKPVTAKPEEAKDATKEPAFQWWVTILVGLAIIAIIVAVIVVTKVTRANKMK